MCKSDSIGFGISISKFQRLVGNTRPLQYQTIAISNHCSYTPNINEKNQNSNIILIPTPNMFVNTKPIDTLPVSASTHTITSWYEKWVGPLIPGPVWYKKTRYTTTNTGKTLNFFGLLLNMIKNCPKSKIRVSEPNLTCP
jgi:hypothetical protein